MHYWSIGFSEVRLMSESRQYFMTIALSLEIESGTSAQFIRQHDLMKLIEAFPSYLLNVQVTQV